MTIPAVSDPEKFDPHGVERGHTALDGEAPLADDIALAGAADVVLADAGHSPAGGAPLLAYAEARDWGVIVAAAVVDGDVDGKDDGAMPLVLREGADPLVLLELRRRCARPLLPRTVTPTEFEKLLGEVYGDTGSLHADSLGFDGPDDAFAFGLPSAEDLLDSADDAPAIRLINGLIAQGLREGASDIHVEPYEQALVVRFREDGVLKEKLRMPPHVAPVLVSRIKVMARLDIAERRVPQDGRIGLSLGGKLVDVRVSTLPNRAGERVVMRLLDKDNAGIDLPQLGLDDHAERVLHRALREPNGIVLVTGPTGSGKTTTLYAGLRTLNDGQRNILTVEDPVEYAVDGVGQTQVNAKVGLSFAAGLRAILRQDPDVVMVGEIRDKETADIAVQASLTGHLVLSTVHTNDSVGAITRMRDMGVEPFLLASTLRAVVAQRLVRRLCKTCSTTGPIDPALAAMLKIKPGTVVSHAAGCDACGQSGYQGRVGLFEALCVDDTIRRMINANAAEEDLADYAFGKDASGNRRGTRLVRAAKRMVLAGETSPEEAARIARRDDGAANP